jgi:hypothetical protein
VPLKVPHVTKHMFKHANNVKVITAKNLRCYNFGVTDARDLWSKEFNWPRIV